MLAIASEKFRSSMMVYHAPHFLASKEEFRILVISSSDTALPLMTYAPTNAVGDLMHK